MTEAQATEPVPAGETPPEVEAPKAEPWTPAKVREWNAYYDIYVAVGVLLLAFLGSANKIGHSSLWSQLEVGRSISATLTPIARDHLSFTREGARWVNIPWLADVVHYQVYRLVSGFAPVDPTALVEAETPDVIEARRAQRDVREQWGVAGLIALDAFIRAMTALVLLRVRHRGPGLWWSAICVTLALGAILGPPGIMIGGVSGPATVAPDTWGQLFLAIEVAILFGVYHLGRGRRIWSLVPLFLLWANVDESFFIGLVLLAAMAIGQALGRRSAVGEVAGGTSPRVGFLVLAACAGVCLINPSFFYIYAAAIGSIVPWFGWTSGPLTPDQLSFFGKELSRTAESGLTIFWVYFFAVTGAGFASFFLNARRFSPGRFLAYTAAAGLWAIMNRFRLEFAVVFAATLALNGQEWYQDQFGTEGRIGRGWASWSIGGRAVTIVLIFLVIFKAVTGYDVLRKTLSSRDLEVAAVEAQFGFGFDPDLFAFEAADALRDSGIEGNVLNTQPQQGDAIIWRAAPGRKTFIDSRRHVFDAETVRKFDEVRRALRDDEFETFRTLVGDYDVAAVMLQVLDAPKTFQTMMNSKNWIPFYDDGAVAMFGRADAKPKDLAYFVGHKLDADRLVYRDPKPIPSTDKLPRATSDLDRIYQSRSVSRPQPHDDASLRWLQPADVAADVTYLPDPARCIMAVREARLAIARKPDDTVAYRRLATAYRLLLLEESGLISGIKPTSENLATIVQLSPQSGLLRTRFEQLLTAMNFAIETAPPPTTPETRRGLSAQHLEMAQYFANQGFVDLARDHLQSAIDLSDSDDLSPDQFIAMTKQLTDFNAQLNEVQTQIANMGLESQAGPLQKAAMARQAGAVALAIGQLDEAIQAGMNQALVKPTLLDLYCQVGQPDKALELWTAGNSADPVLSDGPGTAALRQGRVFLLVGNYQSAVALWGKEALPQLQSQRSLKAPAATRSLMEGDPMSTARTFLELPDEVTKQALWEFDLALACLESGQPVEETAAHFTAALTLSPDLTVRPVIAYYLEKLGKPVPPPRVEPKKADPAAASPAPAPSPAATTPSPATAPAPAAPK